MLYVLKLIDKINNNCTGEINMKKEIKNEIGELVRKKEWNEVRENRII